jgi:hypothetical protein
MSKGRGIRAAILLKMRHSITHLELLERRLERRWRDLALAEQRGQPPRVLERMYAAYVRDLDVYVRAQRAEAGREAHTQLAS